MNALYFWGILEKKEEKSLYAFKKQTAGTTAEDS